MKELDAYKMMFRFLNARYEKLPSDPLGALLGEMQLAADGEPFDPAIAEQWNRIVGEARQSHRPQPVEQQRRAS
jgi:hypothetical protein